MPPKRKTNSHLPVGVYFKHGAYHRVTKGIWQRLCRDEADIAQSMAALPIAQQLDRKELLQFAYKLLARARQNAKGRRGIAFELTKDHVLKMLEQARWKCAVTGMRFTLQIVAGRRPYAPSIDRVDNAKGYLPGNCRIVCLAANYGMNVWGEVVFKKMLDSVRVVDIPETEPTKP